MDDQSSVAGRVDSGRDQTVSSPLHPSVAQDDPQAGADMVKSSATAGQDDERIAPSKTDGADADPHGGESSKGFLQGQGSGNSPEGSAKGFKGSVPGAGKPKGPTKGQRPSTAPASPVTAPGKVLKPTRCQKCHTCRHKQLKKQCLRNKASCP